MKDDPYQRKIITSFNHLHSELSRYNPPIVEMPDIEDLKPKSTFQKLLGSFKHDKKKEEFKDQPHGIYLYGDVGCGKTMLMDLFYSTIPSNLTKSRIHFHQFMQNLHKRSHQLKIKHGNPNIDVIPILAAELSQQSTVLCFDEFQVTDVADAMLLRRLLTLVLQPDHGLILFATSNRAPDDLYINGIQRESFIPCIETIKEKTEVIFLDSPTDYRRMAKPISSVYYSPTPGVNFLSLESKKEQKEHVDQWFEFFSQGHTLEFNLKLKIWGRDFNIPKSVPPYVAQFTFDELCGEKLAAGDYLSLAMSYTSIIVTDIPYLSVGMRDQVRRFITFLDAVYDAHGRLSVTAVAPFSDIFVEPEDLENQFTLKSGANVESIELTDQEASPDEMVTKHHMDSKLAKKAAMFGTLDEERFAFARALSRLAQMSTQDWVDTSGVIRQPTK